MALHRNSKILDLIAQRQKHKEENKTQPNHKRPTNSGASVSGVLIVKWFIFHQVNLIVLIFSDSVIKLLTLEITDGQVQDSHGWSLQNVKRTFWNFIDGVLLL